jgi:hypothetical protein
MPTAKKYESAAEKQAAYRLRCKERKRTLADPVPTAPGRKSWKAMLGRALSLVEQTSEQMQGYYDARSEAWQDSDRGETFIEMMESVVDAAEALREIP